MRLGRPWHTALILLSLAFLGIYLYRLDYLAPVSVRSGPALLGSAVLLVLGFLLQAAGWWATLRPTEHRVGYGVSLASSLTSVFMRYIPGKVFSVLGRAVYVAEHLGHARGRLSMLSLTAQIVALWSGLSVGAVGLLLAGGGVAWRGAVAVAWLVLTVLTFSDVAHGLVERVAKIVLKRDLGLPNLPLRSVLMTLPWFTAMWLTLSAGFYLLLVALVGSDVALVSALGFPLATTIGVAAVFSPGGLGVREGALVAFLLSVGFTTPEAVSASVYARVWFLAGEITAFVFGLLIARRTGARPALRESGEPSGDVESNGDDRSI